MSKIERQSVIQINGKDVAVADILQSLINIPGSYIGENFEAWGLQIPRSDRINALKAALREPVKKEVEKKDADKALVARYKHFEDFSETMLENTFKNFNRKQIRVTYIEELWLTFIDYLLFRGTFEDELAGLIKYSKKLLTVDGDNIPRSIPSYNAEIESTFFDAVDNIDGIPKEQFTTIASALCDDEELKKIASKFGVRIQDQWKKKEYENRVVKEIKAVKLYKKAEEADRIKEVRALNFDELVLFVRDQKLKTSVNLTRSERVEVLVEDILKERDKAPLNPKQTARIKKLTADKRDLGEKLRDEKAARKADVKKREEQISAQTKQIKDLEAQLKKLEKALADGKVSSADQAKLEKEIAELKKALANAKGKEVVKEVVKEKVVADPKQKAALEAANIELLALKGRNKELVAAQQQQTKDHAEALAQAKAKIAELGEEIAKLKAQPQPEAKQAQPAELDEAQRDKIRALLESTANLRNRVEVLMMRGERHEAEISGLRDELARAKRDNDELVHSLDDKDDLIDSLYDEIDELETLSSREEELLDIIDDYEYELERLRRENMTRGTASAVNVYIDGNLLQGGQREIVQVPMVQPAPAPAPQPAPVVAKKKKNVGARVFFGIILTLILIYVVFFFVYGMVSTLIAKTYDLTQYDEFVNKIYFGLLEKVFILGSIY